MNKKKILAGLCAFTIALSAFTGCGTKEKNDGTTTLTWHLSGVKQDESYDKVWNKVNEILKEKYNLKLELVLTDGGNYSQKVQMMNAAREAYDLAFTSNWTNNYHINVENGSLYDITEKLPTIAPKLYGSLSEAEIQAVKIDEKIFAVPNWQVQGRAMGFIVPKEKLDLVGWSMDKFKTLEDLEPYFAAVAEKEPETIENGGSWRSLMSYYGMEMVTQEGLPGAIYFNKEGKPTVFNQYETDEFMNFAKLTRSWVKKGLYPAVRDVQSNQGTTKILKAAEWNNWKPGIGREQSARYGHDYVDKQISPAILSTEVILSTLTGVAATSKYPDEAVKMLEIMYTDKDIYNLLSWGIEGENYEFVDGSDKIIRVKENNTYSMSNWAMGSVINSYILEGNDENLWETTKQFNDAAVASPLLGFTLDNSAISAELGNCETVYKEYISTIEYGLSDPEEVVPKFISDLKNAGVDAVISEVQRQIDEWWESK